MWLYPFSCIRLAGFAFDLDWSNFLKFHPFAGCATTIAATGFLSGRGLARGTRADQHFQRRQAATTTPANSVVADVCDPPKMAGQISAASTSSEAALGQCSTSLCNMTQRARGAVGTR